VLFFCVSWHVSKAKKAKRDSGTVSEPLVGATLWNHSSAVLVSASRSALLRRGAITLTRTHTHPSPSALGLISALAGATYPVSPRNTLKAKKKAAAAAGRKEEKKHAQSTPVTTHSKEETACAEIGRFANSGSVL
jgi:hypothetical protein